LTIRLSHTYNFVARHRVESGRTVVMPETLQATYSEKPFYLKLLYTKVLFKCVFIGQLRRIIHGTYSITKIHVEFFYRRNTTCPLAMSFPVDEYGSSSFGIVATSVLSVPGSCRTNCLQKKGRIFFSRYSYWAGGVRDSLHCALRCCMLYAE
jgi:hypothetical protein